MTGGGADIDRLEEGGGPYTCMVCNTPTWNDDDWCDRCTAEAAAEAEAEEARALSPATGGGE